MTQSQALKVEKTLTLEPFNYLLLLSENFIRHVPATMSATTISNHETCCMHNWLYLLASLGIDDYRDYINSVMANGVLKKM